MIRVLVVDDEDLIRRGLAALLRTADGRFEVTEAADGEEAIAIAATHRPHVVLMDIRMPGIDGITALRRILDQAGDPVPRVLMLTLFDLDEYVQQALTAGASGYLLKSVKAKKLFAAVEDAADGEHVFTPTITRRLIDAYTGPAPAPPREDPNLTAREQDVFRLVAEGLTNPQIAERLFIAEATVKTHLNRGMHKLGLETRAQAVAYAYRTGLATSVD